MEWRKDAHHGYNDGRNSPSNGKIINNGGGGNSSSVVVGPPSGLEQTWRLWRHCCCRYGWYPLIVAPVITIGFLLSLYCSVGCQFIEVDVGFTPSNESWNQSEVRLGLFYFYTGVNRAYYDYNDNFYGTTATTAATPTTDMTGVTDVDASTAMGGNNNNGIYSMVAQGGCQLYTDEFQEEFIDGDRTWRVTRIMSMISGIASLTASLTTWLFVLSPLPASFFWPGVLLPAQMIAFLSEASKFLLFDTAICRTTLWHPSGVDSLPQSAEACRLGDTGFIAIAAGTVHFIGLMFVCLKAPGKRDLDQTFGKNYDTSSDEHNDLDPPPPLGGVTVPSVAGDYRHHHHHHHHHRRGGGGEEDNSQDSFPDVGSDVYVMSNNGESIMQDPVDHHSYVVDADAESQISVSTGQQTNKHQHLHHHHRLGSSGGNSSIILPGGVGDSDTTYSVRDGRVDVLMGSRNSEEIRDDVSSGADMLSAAEQQQRHHVFDPNKSAAEIVLKNSNFQVSESRVNKIEKMELNSVADSDDLIEKFVTDLNLSFQSKDNNNINGSNNNTMTIPS